VIKWGKHGSFYACSSYDKENKDSCNFTKENPINLPDLDSADVQETTQEEYCENCGRVMVLKARALRAIYGLHRLSRLQKPLDGLIRASGFRTFRWMNPVRSVDGI